MAKTRVANFAQLSDGPFTLRIGSDIDRPLTQSISDVPASGEGSMLSWNVKRIDSGNVDYEVFLNGTVLNNYTATLTERHAVQESTGTDSLNQGNNTVLFRVTGGTATLEVTDVMLWYRVEV